MPNILSYINNRHNINLTTITLFLIIIFIFNITACSSASIHKNNENINVSEKETVEISKIDSNKKLNYKDKECFRNTYGFILLTIGSAVAGGMIGYSIWPHEDMIMIGSTIAGIGVGYFLGSFLSYCFGFVCEPFSQSSKEQ